MLAQSQLEHAMAKMTYAAEFKTDAVKQVLDLGHNAKEVAKRLGIPDRTLSSWVGVVRCQRECGAAEVAKLRAEGTRLRSQLRRITEKLEALREAATIVTKMYQ
jgi:transposase